MPRWVTILRVFAVLIAIRGLTNLFKPFGAGNAFVFFGVMLTSRSGMWLAVIVGLLMLWYAWGAWNLKRHALPLSIAYAVFVALNIPLFAIFNPMPQQPGSRIFGIGFLIIGIGVTAGAAYLLYTHRDELS